MGLSSIIRLKSVEHFQQVLAACFGLLMILMLVLAASNYFNLSSLGNRLSHVVNDNNKKTALIYSLRSTARERLILLHRIVHEKDPFVIDDHVLRHATLATKFIDLRNSLAKKLSDGLELREMENLKQALVLAQPAQKVVIDLVQERKYELAKKALDVAILSQEKVVAQLEIFADMQNQFNHELADTAQKDIQHSYLMLIVITGFVVLLAGLTSWYVIRVIGAKNNELEEVNTTLALTNKALETTMDNAVKANRSKTDFIANMSHELRTPMTSIRGALGMLNSGMIDGIPEDAQNMINIADTNSERLMELISDVLDFSKFEAGDLELTHREFSIREEMEKTLIPFVTKVKPKNIDLNIHYDQRFPERIVTDFEHIKHVIHQLLNNAIKFTDKGYVEISMGFAENNSDMLVSVKDTGIGIAEDDISRIFENFEQGDGSSTRKYGGTGIGLAICTKLVTALDGEIGVYSEMGAGSTFWFTIPVQIKQEAA